MKQKKLLTLALIGINLGLLGGCQKANSDEMSGEMRSFYEQLSPDAQQKFMQLDKAHREAAMEIMKHDCKAENQCKGRREQAVEKQYSDQMQKQGRLQMNGSSKK